MSIVRPYAIQHQLFFLVAGVVSLALGVAAMLFIVNEVKTSHQTLLESRKAVAVMLSDDATAALQFERPEIGEQLMRTLRALPEVLYAEIRHDDGRLFINYVPPGHQKQAIIGISLPVGSQQIRDGMLELAEPIVLNEEIIGALYLRTDLSAHRARLHAYYLYVPVVVLVALFIALLVASQLQRLITKPLFHLLDVMEQVAREQNYHVRATPRGSDEIRLLIQRFNEMLSQIESRDGQLESAKEKAEAASQIKTRFLAIMSHEIRTPMNAILGFTEILRSQITDPRHLEYTAAIVNSGDTLLRLMNDMLDLSKVEAGKLHIHPVECNLRRMCKDLQQIFDFRIQEKGLVLSMHFASSVPEWVLVDEMRLRQILLNLLGNAVKFTEKGRVDLKIKYLADFQRPDQGSLELQVKDTGIGIPESEFERIFEAFEQRTGQEHATYGGTGLGLTITRRLVELMGGSITLESQVGSGTTFGIVLPGVVNQSLTAEVRERNEETPNQPIQFAPATILVVDDEQLNRKLLRGFLFDQPLSILEAENGKVGVNQAREHHPALVLMDMKMPVMNGFEATHILKEDPATAEIPIIAVTALAEEEVEQVLELCDAYLPKPVKKPDLMEFMRRFLARETITPPPEDSDEPLRAQPMTPQLRMHFHERLSGRWGKLDDTASINEIEEFAQHVKRFAREAQCQPLMLWADQLERQTSLFDITGMRARLRQLEEWLASAPTA